IYKTERAKFRAVVTEIEEWHRRGRPVLVGTRSIEKNEQLSEMLRRRGVPHEILNAKQHEREAEIIAQAGRLGAVTIATNMDRRGIDEDTPIEHGLVTRQIENAQKKVEQYHFDVRKHVLEYDDVLNVQRKVIYGERRKALFGDNVRENVLDMFERLLGTLVDAHCPADARPEEWDLEGLRE